MSKIADHVNAGQIISSSLMNLILDKLGSMDDRIAALESAGGGKSTVVISGFDPLGQIAIGQPLTILGTGFPSPPADDTVTLNTTPVPATNYMFGSSNTKLKFVVPDVPGVTGVTPITVVVKAPSGLPAVATYSLSPSQSSGPPATITKVTDTNTSQVNIIGIGHKMQIQGTNFAPTPGTGNVITFTYTPQGKPPVVYPKQGQTLTIDPSSTATQIIVTVPDITEITANLGTQPVSLSVANGNNTPAVVGIQVFR